jgi:hypothetical protein
LENTEVTEVFKMDIITKSLSSCCTILLYSRQKTTLFKSEFILAIKVTSPLKFVYALKKKKNVPCLPRAAKA